MPRWMPSAVLVSLVLTAPRLAAADGAAPTQPAASTAAPGGSGGPAGSAPGPDDAWGFARWGRSPEEVLAALPGQATRLRPEVKLADGNVIAVGIDAFRWEGSGFDVRFVFGGGRLALVSLRTSPGDYADAERYARLKDSLVRRWGAPLEDSRDDQFIELRQARWDRGAFRVDLKYIPGVVALVVHPPPSR